MAKDDKDTDSFGRNRSLRWKYRMSRSSRLLSESTVDTTFDDDNQSTKTRTSISEETLPAATPTSSFSSRDKDFHMNFKSVPLEEHLIQDFKCALQKDVQLQGRLYVSKQHVCFKSNILGYVTSVELHIQQIKNIERVRTVRWMPRVVQITVNDGEKYAFTSFLTSISSRDDAYFQLLDVWHQVYPPTPSTTMDSNSAGQLTSGSQPEEPVHVTQPQVYKASPVERRSTSATPTSPRQLLTRRRAQTIGNTEQRVTWPDQDTPHAETEKTVRISLPHPSSATSGATATNSYDHRRHSTPSAERHRPAAEDGNLHLNRSYHPFLVVTAVVLVLSHVILAFRLYTMSKELSMQQQHTHDPHDSFWVTSQMQHVKDQAQNWQTESLRQRQQLLNMIPQ
ncbi:GRAM-domain-containing protein [Hesseltinella vesiculosa]|uniref:GRAM-domain-containing protein n=1 Tax=Hesseltinella vesiculosa TaxID=101127 RepID=A0A1X2G8E2_9FUNG|nr:GRAM-domain-containing protein [Hesseltinella vesiculosa]